LPRLFSEELNPNNNTEKSPEKIIENILSDAENLSGTDLRSRYIKAAELKQLTGDLKGAAELFEKASLAVKGEKDFQSLYRSAVLQIETADYKAAEASIRAIMTFSDNLTLRIKAAVLNSRIKSLLGNNDQAYALIMDLFEYDSEVLPFEAYIWARDFYNLNNSAMDLTKLNKIINDERIYKNAGYPDESYIPNPENVFGITVSGVSAAEQTAVKEEPEAAAVDIQLGSFQRIENAEDLVITLEKAGYKAVTKIKKVNDKIYNIVVIPQVAKEGVQQFIVKLKSSGFEGYPLY
jgi:hypothetical protein